MKHLMITQVSETGDLNIYDERNVLVATVRNNEAHIYTADREAVEHLTTTIDRLHQALDAATQIIQPCPFCGAEARVIHSTVRKQHRVECFNDHALNRWNDTPLEAIQAWNERPK